MFGARFTPGPDPLDTKRWYNHSWSHVLYCNIGNMREYNGSDTERPVGGGEFTSREVGHEVNNSTRIQEVLQHA